MEVEDAVRQVYALISRRELAASTAAWRVARHAVAEAQGAHLLALQEAITDSLNSLLTEIAEHGLQNQALWGVAAEEVDVQAMSDECAAAWADVKRLRAAGLSSRELIDTYIGSWMDPIGSRDWLERMRLGVPYQQRPAWIDRVSRTIRGESEEGDE